MYTMALGTALAVMSLWSRSMSMAASTGGGDVYRLLVLHTNDMHSHFDQIDRTGAQCTDAANDSGECYGGFPRLKTAVDRERARAATDGTLFLNAGDTFQGTAFYTYLKWTAVARMLQTLGIDVMSLGNHEFDDGVKDLHLFLKNITIPVVASNLDLSDEPLLAKERNLMKSKVLTVNGRKIGIIGYLTPETKYTASVGNVKIFPEVPTVRAEAKRLKREGVNILIALGHSGFEIDTQIAKEVEDIDLVVGGHSNTFLYNGNVQDIETPTGPYPFWVNQPKTNRKVPVVQASHITKYLGKLWVEFDEAGEVIRSYGNPILLDSHIEQDPEVLNEVKLLENKIDVMTKQVIGSTSVFLESFYCRARECNIGNFITDSFIDYNIRTNMKSFDLTKYWTDAPIAIVQGGGIRSNINHLRMQGNITHGDMVMVMPFMNEVGKVTIKGFDIWNAFEYSVRRYSTTEFYGEFLQVSGIVKSTKRLKVKIDLKRPSGKRVQSIYARCRNCTMPIYQKLDLNGDYTIIISAYLLQGGDGFTFNKLSEYQYFGLSDLEIVVNEIRRKSPIRPEIEQRITLLNAEHLHKTSGQLKSAPLKNLILLLMIVISLINGL